MIFSLFFFVKTQLIKDSELKIFIIFIEKAIKRGSLIP